MARRTDGPLKARCPHCKRRATMKERDGIMDTFDRYETVTWQCIYCGAVCEPHGPLRNLIVTGFARVVLAPGELEQLRTARTV